MNYVSKIKFFLKYYKKPTYLKLVKYILKTKNKTKKRIKYHKLSRKI